MTASKKSLWGNPKSKCLWFPAIPEVQDGEQQQQPLQQQDQVEDVEVVEDGGQQVSDTPEGASEVGGRVAAAPPEVGDLLNSAGRKCLKEEIKFPPPPQQQDQVVEDVQAPRSAERRQRVPQARQCGPKGGRGKAKAKVQTRAMRTRW